MIHRISLENFFSVAEEQVLDFRVPANAPDLGSFRDSAALPGVRFPTAIGFFGPNASGKSNMLRALSATATFARHSFSIPPLEAIPLFQPYATKGWWDRPTKIRIDFDVRVLGETNFSVYRYELGIGHTPTTCGRQVTHEALFHAPNGRFRRIFERQHQEFEFGREFALTSDDARVRSIRPNASVISTLAQLNHRGATSLIKALKGLVTNFERLPGREGTMLAFYRKYPGYLLRLNRFLRRLDLGLEAMRLEQDVSGLVAKFLHAGLDREIALPEESAGTRRFLEIFPLLQYALDHGGIAVLDELDIYLHPLLLPEILRWFASFPKNPKGGQLLFTAHNPAILNELEKEQVFFTQKPDGRPTRVYGAAQIQGLRREPNLLKKYLSGALGAVPQIG